MINHIITYYFIHKKFRHLLALLFIFSALVGLFASCSTEEQSPKTPAQEEVVRETSEQEPTVQIELEKPDQTEEIQKNIRAAIEQMTQSKKLKIGDVWIAAIVILPEFYERRNFKPAWTTTDKIQDLMRAIDDIEMDGLIPDDYHRRQLRNLFEEIEVQSPPKPQLLADMTYLEFNPTWTVPPTILAKDILPAVRKDPGYLKKRNIRVIDSKGKVVDPKSINWSKYTGKNFPYLLRQDPGPSNALGQPTDWLSNRPNKANLLPQPPELRYF
jgi:murein L,D-transpeptidase YcbB/YkuD